MKSEEIIHSCCPEKTSFEAPQFKKTSTLKLHTADIETWECQNCGSVIMIVKPLSDA